MKKINESVVAVLSAGALIAGIYGCNKQGTPAEDAGKEIDQTVDKVDQKINTTVDKAGQKIKDTGQKIKDTVKDAKK